MSFDECPQFYQPYDYVKKSIERTSRWAERGLKAHRRPHDQGLFGIVQGAGFKDLRRQSASDLVSMDFPGYSIGGLAVGESHKEMNEVLDFTVPMLPENKPRYLMGVGAPDSLIDGVIRGVDMFDCVLPTRIARNGTCMTSEGRLVVKMQLTQKISHHLTMIVIATHVAITHVLTFVTCLKLMKPLGFV